MLRFTLGDITTQAVDAIVNAANEALSDGAGVNGAIHLAAGPALPAACRALAPCPTGQARITPGFELPARFIIHTVGPVWSGGAHGEDDLLASAYRSCIEVADEHDLRTVAFPAISCGIFGYPVDDAARIAVDAVREAMAGSSVEQATFVLFTQDLRKTFEAAAQG